MQIAMDAAQFTAEEANGLRRAMATFRKLGTISEYEDMMVSRMIERGYEPGFAKRCFDQVKGFGDYGFPESHAASFALLVYVSSWLKCHHPDVFCAALLNAQPMGFYAPAQIVRDARENGVEVRPADVNYSDWDNTLEPGDGRYHAVRLGLRQITGLQKAETEFLLEARGAGYERPDDIRRRAGLSRRACERLAAADAFGSVGLSRRDALWTVRGQAAEASLPLFAAMDASEQGAEAEVKLPTMPASEQVVQDYQMTRLSLKAHPLSFLRASYAGMGWLDTKKAVEAPNGWRVTLAGIVLVRQRPGSASGVCFITIEDEEGIANIVVWPRVFDRFRATVMGARILMVRGRVQRADNVTHIVAEQLIDRTGDLYELSEDFQQDPLKGALAHADEVLRPGEARRGPARKGGGRQHPRNVAIMPKSRDFH